jgi:hypothetical protein
MTDKPIKKSDDFEYDTIDYYRLRVREVENDRNIRCEELAYYQNELEKAHTLLGRIIHQTSERWDSVRLTKYYPTDNLHNKRGINNLIGK